MKLPFLLILSCWCITHASEETKPLNPIIVQAESENDATIQGQWLKDIVGTQIYAGKKTAVLDFDSVPKIQGNNYRQALSMTPSLLLSEESSPLLSIGYRGLTPGRVQFTQVLRDGIPIHADQFGYPEAYYTPPIDTVDRIEFLHGGAALQYGPQPGGALNYVTHEPRTDKAFSLRSQHVVGSDNLYSTFTSVDGTQGKLGYYAYYNHRQSDGLFDHNSDYNLNNFLLKLNYLQDNGGKWTLVLDTYKEEHGEPGGLTEAQFASGKYTASRLMDRFELKRDSISLTYQQNLTGDANLKSNLWYTNYHRDSQRQKGGGFGTLPKGSSSLTNTIQKQGFDTFGWDARYSQFWGGSTKDHTFSAGVQLYYSDSPLTDHLGLTPNATSGLLLSEVNREVFYAPVYIENQFKWSNFSITPGIRIENVQQKIKEIQNISRNNNGTIKSMNGLESIDDSLTVVLGGLGAQYILHNENQIYANISQSYRPALYTQAVPTSVSTVVNENLSESKSLEYELGYRGAVENWMKFDTSLFLLQFDDQIGTVGNTLQNIGNSQHGGVDLSTQVNLLHFAPLSSQQELWYYINATYLDAEITKGNHNTKGKTPRYAPDYMIRTGFNYLYSKNHKISLSSTFVDEHFNDDANSSDQKIPTYMVWDLTSEWKIREHLTLLAGINNIFDESYYARIVNAGIDPSAGRNIYVGLSLDF